MWQVLVNIGGVLHHEGFFDDKHSAVEHRDFVSCCLYYCDCDGEVIVIDCSSFFKSL